MAKFTPEIYARAVREATSEAPAGERDKVFKRFIAAVARRGDARKLPAIAKELQYEAVRARGGRMVTIEFAHALGREMPKFKSFLKPEDHLESRVNSDLVAGVRITIDEERELDFSLARRLNRMFR